MPTLASATAATLSPARRERLPVTLLSGFLGSGKTTLLEHILTSPDHGLRIGVIVNDIGALNIDAALLENHQVTQRHEEIVALQNGCLCCTLRGDLLEEVAKLAEANVIDYLVIESSGVSEPMQVAEAFSEEFAEMHVAAAEEVRQSEGDPEKNKRLAAILDAGGLYTVARLDTCATVVDAANFMADYNTADFLVDRHKAEDVPEEDDRNISDLQTDQIEFANVIIINKCDLVSPGEVSRVKAVVKALNPDAKVITSIKSKVNIRELIDTKMYSYEKAALGAGWLRSLHEQVKPETEEYGIGTFVYRARRPFHPLRLWETIRNVFVVIQESYMDDGDEEGNQVEEDAMDGIETAENPAEEGQAEEAQPQLNPKARLASKQASETWSPLLRSKGFLWLATRPKMFGEWSQAGVMLTISGGDVWRCELPEDEWPEDTSVRDLIRKDFEGEWGDRRQEIVFIGQQMRTGGEARIKEAMDSCLLSDAEMKKWHKAMKHKNAEEKLVELFDDGFEDWMEEDHSGHDHGDGNGHDHNQMH